MSEDKSVALQLRTNITGRVRRDQKRVRILALPMPLSAALPFLLLLLLQDGTCSMRQKKITEFRAKLQAKEIATSANASQSQIKRKGRVFYPIGYGADPSGIEDSSDAILQTVNEALQVRTGLQMLAGIKDLGGVVIDLQGGNYKISRPLKFPAAVANLVVKGGSLRASDTFPGDRHLIELQAPSWQPNTPSRMYYEDITFRDILFDSGFRGGGILAVDAARTRINNCFFLHFTTQGVLVRGGHETFISSCFLGQHSTVGGDKFEKHFSGTAIHLQGNDNAVTDVVVFSAAIGILLGGQANILTGVHCYNKATALGGVGILVRASLTRIVNCYLDYTAIVMEDPVQVHVANGFFLGDANVVLKSITGRISGLTIVDNMFSGDPNNMVPIVKLDGHFSSIQQVVIDHNSVDGMSLKSTVAKLTVAGNGTKWVADFSGLLVFPDRINHFQHSFYIKDGASSFALHAVTNVSNNIVIVESDRSVNALVSVLVDQYSSSARETRSVG